MPQKKDFYNQMNSTRITDEDYQHAIDVLNILNIANMEEYTMLYNQTDVILQVDIMENFRNVCIETY